MDLRIQRSVVSTLRSRRQSVESGPFVIGIDPETDSPFINYATPVPGAPITAADVTALVKAFGEAGRRPRLEYVTVTSPGLETLLLDAGFAVEERHDYLNCTPGSLIVPPAPDGFTLADPATDDDRAGLAAAQNEAFGGTPVAYPDQIKRFRRLQENGGVILAARTSGGDCAGGGQATVPSDGVSEIAGIAVRPAFRRRGVAGAVTAGITERLFSRGADFAWLEASGPDSWRVYERVGFSRAGNRLYISMPEPSLP
ncbi:MULTISPECIES: GNAT family N-acetyltransferase [Actinoplanes]|uniref:GNAT family N-acetyltransferase n=1 Tax=Actinoplanes TaxID=1865 RepID=UPI0005F27D7A|nr:MULTISPECIES: GNAT family N-acetyltransferase [Actinoplanes]GLY07540.1 hypothetical protein Acsp01_79190 [Actinoplanes sp. NBRC 101535]